MDNDICYVYIIETTTGAYKIGVANNPKTRYQSLKTGIPDPSRILLVIRCQSRELAFGLEREMHRALDPYHSANEWFKPPKAVLGELILDLPSRIESFYPEIEFFMEPVDTEPEIIATGMAKSTRDRTRSILNIIQEISRALNGPAPQIAVLDQAEILGIDREKAESIIYRLKQDGSISEPRPGMLRFPNPLIVE